PLSIFDQLCPKTERSVRESSAPPTKIERCHHTSSFPPFAVYSTRVERYTQPEWSVILNQSGALFRERYGVLTHGYHRSHPDLQFRGPVARSFSPTAKTATDRGYYVGNSCRSHQ